MRDYIIDIPFYWLILWAFFSFGLSIWYYSKKNWLKDLSQLIRWSLLSARFFGLFFIGLLIVGILFQSKSYSDEKPILTVISDNSSSMLNYSDSIEVRDQLPKFLDELIHNLPNFNVVNYNLTGGFDKVDSLKFTKEKTDLSFPLKQVYDRFFGRNLGAVIFISDGNFNTGMNPISVAQQLSAVPIYTLGVGDTIQKSDQLISQVRHNDIAFLGNKFPIEISIEGHLVGKERSQLTLSSDGKTIHKEELNYPDQAYNLLKRTVYIEATKVGFMEFKLEVSPLQHESNLANNVKTFYVEILDARSKVLLLAGAPHPDISAIKNTLSSDDNLELQSERISNLPSNLAVYDLIIWHEPGIGTTPQQLDQLKSANVPIWYIIGPATGTNVINQLGLPISLRTTGQTDNIRPSLNIAFNKFVLTDVVRESLRVFPPLTASYGRLTVNQPIDALFHQAVGGITKDDPLHFFGEKGTIKYGVTFGEGLWRWRLGEFQRFQRNDAFNEVIGKTVQYLAVRANTSKLRVQLPKRFTEDDEVVINASFYNDSYEPITTVAIDFLLTDDKGEEQQLSFIPQKSTYSLSVGFLPPGKYTWTASAKQNGDKHEKSGVFIVENLELEGLDTRANHNLLYRLSAASHEGMFTVFSDRDKLYTMLNEQEGLVTVSYESVRFKKLIDYKWLLFLIVLCFSIEWFLRRYNGAY